MARRSANRFYIELPRGDKWKLSAYLWRYYAEKRLIEPISKFGAKLAAGVVSLIVDGELVLRRRLRWWGPSIPPSWRWVERRRWSYLEPDELRKAVQEMCGPQWVRKEMRVGVSLGRFAFRPKLPLIAQSLCSLGRCPPRRDEL